MLYRYGLIRHINKNDSTKYKNMLYLDVNEMDDEWGSLLILK